MEVGLRVVRGPDWAWQNQDNGEGHVGTVVEIGKPGSTTSPDKTVVVQWDSGTRTNYRVGYKGSYDLRILDNAPIGVKHPNIICDGCNKQGVQGMRWKCLKCYDFDLCNTCYMVDKHDLSHPFLRFDTVSSMGAKIGKRAGVAKIMAVGIFAGSKVVRGPDWDWDNQDGGEGKPGKAIDIRDWENESGRSVANITWSSGVTNVYRLGHKGKVDLKYIQETPGGYYYHDHLPVLGGMHTHRLSSSSSDQTSGGSAQTRQKIAMLQEEVDSAVTCQMMAAQQQKVEREQTRQKMAVLQQKVDNAQTCQKITVVQQKVETMEKDFTCAICFMNIINITFLCGHSTCHKCANRLKNCHMCRKPITQRIDLFL